MSVAIISSKIGSIESHISTASKQSEEEKINSLLDSILEWKGKLEQLRILIVDLDDNLHLCLNERDSELPPLLPKLKKLKINALRFCNSMLRSKSPITQGNRSYLIEIRDVVKAYSETIEDIELAFGLTDEAKELHALFIEISNSNSSH